jgi:hypothetical protein
MAKPKFKRDSKAIAQFLKSEVLRKELERRAENIAKAAGEGFEAHTFVGFDRVHGWVRATTWEARKAEADNRALTRAREAGRR